MRDLAAEIAVLQADIATLRTKIEASEHWRGVWKELATTSEAKLAKDRAALIKHGLTIRVNEASEHEVVKLMSSEDDLLDGAVSKESEIDAIKEGWDVLAKVWGEEVPYERNMPDWLPVAERLASALTGLIRSWGNGHHHASCGIHQNKAERGECTCGLHEAVDALVDLSVGKDREAYRMGTL